MKQRILLILGMVFLLPLLSAGTAKSQDLSLNGFVEGAFGGRIQTNSLLGSREYTLNETRLQLKFSHYGDNGEFYSAIDILGDNVGGGSASTRIQEAYFQFSFGDRADMKVGRQILTWGTGDLLFINDLFPKDYVSFFIGREDQYLKLPSDAIKAGFYTPYFDMDVIAMPVFASNRLPNGMRLSYFNPLAGSSVGESNLPAPVEPDAKFSKSEFAARMYRYFGSYQGAGYVFRGFYKDPMGVDPMLGAMYYPELSAYGASIRGPLLSGVISMEYGYYDSRTDRDGVNPLIPNSQHKYLVGFERQWWSDFTMGMQYYGEYMLDHDKYAGSLPAGAPVFDQLRQVFTTRLTQMMHYQTINLSLFAFYSTTDKDWHVRPNVSYKYSDQVSLTLGGNFFGGEKMHTLFGQFENNNNVYARFRYYF